MAKKGRTIKYKMSFINDVHTANGDMTHKQLMKKFKLTKSQLNYVLYKRKPEYAPMEEPQLTILPRTKPEPVPTLWERVKGWFT